MPKADSKSQDPIMVGTWEEGEEDDDDDFMETVNVYLNAREDASVEGKALEGILRRNSSVVSKTVKFADEEDVIGTPVDKSKSKQELLAKISRLTELLREAEELASIERDKRKKNEKNLLKLAKEMKKRNAQQEADKHRIEELEEKKQYLEHHWVLAGKELDQEKILRQKLQSEQDSSFERALLEEKEKSTKLQKEYEKKIDIMKESHAKHCDELGREILKTNLEADRLHAQLVGSPRRSRMFAKAAMWKDSPLRVVAASMAFAIVTFAAFKARFFSAHAICAPIMPGRTLSRADGSEIFEAPWWAPTSYKSTLSQRLCGSSEITLQWVPDGLDQKLVLSNDQKVLLKKVAIVKAEIYGDRLRTWNRKGLAEDHRSLWSV